MYDVTKLVSQSVFDFLLNNLPTPKQLNIGRKHVAKSSLLNGILQVLVNGVAWNKIAYCGCSYSSCFRYFREIQRRGNLHLIYDVLVHDKTNITECAIDTTTVTSFRFKQVTGWDGKHKKIGTKISLISDISGLPADIVFDKGNTHDLRFVPKHLKNTAGTRKNILNLDKGYTSKQLRRDLRNKGIRVNMETRKKDYTAKRGPKFRFDKEKYKVRFQIERLNGWLKSFKRLRTRVEFSIASFKAFVYLALIVVLIRN